MALYCRMIDIYEISQRIAERGGKALAAASGVPYKTVMNIARGRVKAPRIDTINKLLPHLRKRKP